MILKALYDYYQRRGDLPKFGRELKEIGFLLVIDRNGKFLRFEDRRIDNKHAKAFLVKKSVGKAGIKPIPNLLYDNSAYVFGFPNDDKGKRCRAAFIQKVRQLHEAAPEDADLNALVKFYETGLDEMLAKLKQDPLWSDVESNLSKKYSNFSFLIQGDAKIVAEKPELLDLLNDDSDAEEHVCLITGGHGVPVKTTTASSIKGSQATAKLVSFQKKSGYDSYGKEQGANAPISEEAEFAYSTALKHMLASDSRNKFLIGTRTFVFWSSSDGEAGQKAEESLFQMLGFSDDKDDDPDSNIENVRAVFKSIYSGELKTSLEDKFFILGLAPNSARIAVVYWAEIPLKDFARRISQHFDDMEITGARKPYMSLKSILSAVTLGGKSTDATPNLPDAIVKSIFEALPYPYTLFAGCIRRIRAEQNIFTTRAAILKAYLNRLNNNNEQTIEIMLDKENTNQGYLCGRLFAVLEKIQEDASNLHTIRDRYLNSASATPAAVFANILNLSSHHVEKLNEGRRIFYEKIKQEIISKIDAVGFPAHLELQDQGRFFVGYYHQRQDFFTKNDEEKENNK